MIVLRGMRALRLVPLLVLALGDVAALTRAVPRFEVEPGWLKVPQGWALGQRYLNGSAAVVDAPLGRGRVLVFGPEITYRAQPHGTFKFLFNAILYPKAERIAGS